jgi:hypothetical protein
MLATVLSTTKLTVSGVGLLATAINTSNLKKIRAGVPIIFRANLNGENHTPDSLIAGGLHDLSGIVAVTLECDHSNNESLIQLATEWTMAGFSVRIAFTFHYRSRPEPINFGLPYTFGLTVDEAYHEHLDGVWQAKPGLKNSVHRAFIDMPLVTVF